MDSRFKLFLSFAGLTVLSIGSIIYLDFRADFLSHEAILGRGENDWKRLETLAGTDRVGFYKKIYEKNKKALFDPQRQGTKIPKQVHFIWLGPQPLSRAAVENMRVWQKMQPNWRFYYWTDQDGDSPVPGIKKRQVQEYPFRFLDNLMEATSNYVEKADLLRFEILLQEGGLAVDVDVACYHPFDNFHQGLDFYSVLGSGRSKDYKPLPAVGIIGSKPRHPILEGTARLLNSHWRDGENPFKHAAKRTFQCFNEAVESYIDKEGNIDIILPFSFFLSWDPE